MSTEEAALSKQLEEVMQKYCLRIIDLKTNYDSEGSCQGKDTGST